MYRVFLIVVLSLTFVACGGGSQSDPAPVQKTGVFLDSPVANIDYKTETLSGVTNEKGEFKYIDGEKISFKIGDLVFPAVKAAPVVTPEDFSPQRNARDPIVRNALRLLQSLDIDGDLDNGIEISDKAKLNAKAVDLAQPVDVFEKNADVLGLIKNGDQKTPVNELVNEYLAFLHFAEQKASLSKFTNSDVDNKTFYQVYFFENMNAEKDISTIAFANGKVTFSRSDDIQISDYTISSQGYINYTEKVSTSVAGQLQSKADVAMTMVMSEKSQKFLSICSFYRGYPPYCHEDFSSKLFYKKEDAIAYYNSVLNKGFDFDSLNGKKLFIASNSRILDAVNDDVELVFDEANASFVPQFIRENFESEDYFLTLKTLQKIKAGSYVSGADGYGENEVSSYQLINSSTIKLNDFLKFDSKDLQPGLNVRFIALSDNGFLICIDSLEKGSCTNESYFTLFTDKSKIESYKVFFDSYFRDFQTMGLLKNAFSEEVLQSKTFYNHIQSNSVDTAGCPSNNIDYLESYTFENGSVTYQNCKDETITGNYSITPLGFLKLELSEKTVYFKREDYFSLPLPSFSPVSSNDKSDSRICKADSIKKVRVCSGGSLFSSDYERVKKSVNDANEKK